MGRGTWYYSLGVSSIIDAFVRVDGRSYLLSGATNSSEANGIIRNPKLELESFCFTFDLVPFSCGKRLYCLVGRKVIEQVAARSGMDSKMAELTMSSPNHFTSDIEDAFSSMNILNYTSVSSDYFPVSLGSNSFNSSENPKDNMIPPVFSSFYNNPYLKDVQAFYAKELPISSPDPITPPAILTPSPHRLRMALAIIFTGTLQVKTGNYKSVISCHLSAFNGTEQQ
ncbi:hypothetical protein Tco_0924205 [Tanacetum coccineum]|uniref:Uncharacterized protein n=1 Tax=Tanacetum coccineum TaxID=301880 RepID=A0ABQ5D359_9ASTR